MLLLYNYMFFFLWCYLEDNLYILFDNYILFELKNYENDINVIIVIYLIWYMYKNKCWKIFFFGLFIMFL